MVTGNEVEVQVPLASASYGEERWEPGFEFPVTIINDDAQRFLLNGTEVELDEEKPLRGYEEQLLELIGVSGENYRITDIRWDGAVSYTHLDVYKRQCLDYGGAACLSGGHPGRMVYPGGTFRAGRICKVPAGLCSCGKSGGDCQHPDDGRPYQGCL